MILQRWRLLLQRKLMHIWNIKQLILLLKLCICWKQNIHKVYHRFLHYQLDNFEAQNWKWVYLYDIIQFSSVAQSCPTLCNPMRHARPPCPSPTPRVYSDACLPSQWCHPAISSSVIPFSSCPQSLPASGSFPMSQPFAWGGKSIGVSASASVLPMNTRDWSLGWTGWISLQS